MSETGPRPRHYFRGKEEGVQGEACDRPRREEREKERKRRGSPNEYLISAYLTPG